MAQRLEYLDVARGAGVLLVVAAHEALLGNAVGPWVFEFYMPLFFVITGYLYGRCGLMRTAADCKKRTLHFVREYFGVCGVLGAVWLAVYPLRGQETEKLGRVAFSILYGRFIDENNPLLTDACWTGQLWFLTLMCTAGVLYYLLARLDTGRPARRVLLVCVLLGAAQAMRFVPVLLPWCLDTAPMGALLLLVASWLGEMEKRRQNDENKRNEAPAAGRDRASEPARATQSAGAGRSLRYGAALAVLAAVFVLLHDTYDLHLKGYGRFAGMAGTVCFFAAGFSGSLLFLALCRALCRFGPAARLLGGVGRHSLAVLEYHILWLWALDGVFLRLPAALSALPGWGVVRSALLLTGAAAGSLLTKQVLGRLEARLCARR
jgi:fucose 4-O-acetylase-like acetyltransferase